MLSWLKKTTNIIAIGALALMGITQELKAEELFSKLPIPRNDYRILTLENGDPQKYQLHYNINAQGEVDVHVFLVEARWLTEDTKLLVLRGRDINSDGKVDVWFYNDGPVIKSFRQEAKDEDTWPVVKTILKEHSFDESRWISTIVAREILADVSYTVEGEIQDMKELEKMQIDLQDLDYRILEMEAQKQDTETLEELRRVSADGWQKLMDRWNKSRIEDRHKRMMGDALLFLGGGLAFKGIKFLLVKAFSIEKIAVLRAYLKGKKAITKPWSGRVSKRIPRFVPRAAGVMVAKKFGRSALRFLNPFEAITWLSRKQFFSRFLKGVGQLAVNVVKASWSQRGYIAAAQTTQLAIESYLRGYWEFSKVPLVLNHPVTSTKEFFNQVANDKGLLQNMTYMTLQTTLLSGVSTILEKNGAGIMMKYAVCSVVTMIDSTTVNIFIQGKNDYPRIAFDTAWEVLIGGSQVHLDLHFLRWADELAKKFANPKLKLVGYLLATADQGTGYGVYNKATGLYFEDGSHPAPTANAPGAPSDSQSQGGPLILPPETTQAIDKQMGVQLNGLPPVIMVPVLAPQS